MPLTYRQLKSMQEMQRLAPEISALKEKYKDDKQRQQQEMMKFYQENKINPLASCLPLLLQLPVFISLFYMLRTDLKKHICGPQLIWNTSTSSPLRPPWRTIAVRSAHRKHTGCNAVAPGSAKFLFIPDITDKATGVALIVLIVALRRLAARLDADRDGDRRPQPAPPDAAAAARLRGDPVPLPGGLLVYWITTNLWTIGQQFLIRRRLPPPAEARQRHELRPTASPSAPCGEALADAAAQRRRRHASAEAASRQAQRRCRRAAAAPPPPAAQEEETLGQTAMSDPRTTADGDLDDDELEPVEALEELLEEIVDGLGLDGEVEVARSRRRAHAAGSRARTSGCSSAATARRSTPCSTSRSASSSPTAPRACGS